MQHNPKNICKTVISGFEQNFNKQLAEFGISNTFSPLYLYFWQYQYIFQVLKTDCTIQYFFNTTWEPCH